MADCEHPRKHFGCVNVPKDAYTPPPRSRSIILLVEDDAMTLRIMERVLQRGGFSVIAVRNGRQALKAFSQYADNLTLMLVGVETPVMAGAEFVEIIPTLTPRIPVVFTSTQSERAISALTRSGYPLLYKPFAPVDLLEAVWAVVPKGDPLAS